VNDIEKARQARRLRDIEDSLASLPNTNFSALQLPQCTMVQEWLTWCGLPWYGINLMLHELSPTREQMEALKPQLENLHALTLGYVAHHCKLYGIEKIDDLPTNERIFFTKELCAFIGRHDHFRTPEELEQAFASLGT